MFPEIQEKLSGHFLRWPRAIGRRTADGDRPAIHFGHILEIVCLISVRAGIALARAPMRCRISTSCSPTSVITLRTLATTLCSAWRKCQSVSVELNAIKGRTWRQASRPSRASAIAVRLMPGRPSTLIQACLQAGRPDELRRHIRPAPKEGAI